MLEKTEGAIKNAQSRDTGNMWTKDTERKQTTENKKMSIRNPPKNGGWIQVPEKGKWCPVTSLHILWKIDIRSVLGRNGMKIEVGKQVTMKILTHNLSSAQNIE